MRKKRLSKDVSFSATAPTSYLKRMLPAELFLSQTKEFLDEYFYGSYVSDDITVSQRSITVSMDGFAYFLKTVLKAIFGRELLKMKAMLSRELLVIRLEFSPSLISSEDMDILRETALRSGFDFQMRQWGAALTMEAYVSPSLGIFARTDTYVYDTLESTFFR